MAAPVPPPSVGPLGTLSSKFLQLTEVRAGLADGASNLALRAYDPTDATNHTLLTLSNDGGNAIAAFSAVTGGVDVNVRLTGVGSPAASTDAANKAYVDAVAQGLSPKNPAAGLLVSDFTPDPGSDGSAILISDTTVFANDVVVLADDAFTVNGVVVAALGIGATEQTLVYQSRILCTFNGTPNSSSGVYYVESAVPALVVLRRCIDMDNDSALVNEVKLGSYVFAGGSSGYVITALSNSPPVLGTDTITFALFSLVPTLTGSTHIDVDPVTNVVSLKSVASTGLLLTSTNAAADPQFGLAIGPDAAYIDGDYANVLTLTDTGNYAGGANSGGLILSHAAAWAGDGSHGQSLYYGSPARAGTMRSVLVDNANAVADAPVLQFERFDGAAWVPVFTVSQ